MFFLTSLVVPQKASRDIGHSAYRRLSLLADRAWACGLGAHVRGVHAVPTKGLHAAARCVDPHSQLGSGSSRGCTRDPGGPATRGCTFLPSPPLLPPPFSFPPPPHACHARTSRAQRAG